MLSWQCSHFVPLSSCVDNKFCRYWLLRLRYQRIVFWSLTGIIFKNELVSILKCHHRKFVFCWENWILFLPLLLNVLTIPCKQYFLYQILNITQLPDTIVRDAKIQATLNLVSRAHRLWRILKCYPITFDLMYLLILAMILKHLKKSILWL